MAAFKLLHELPPPHYRTAKLLFRHLSTLSLQDSRTSMPAKNLAICWAPNLLKDRRFDTPEHLLASIGAPEHVPTLILYKSIHILKFSKRECYRSHMNICRTVLFRNMGA